MQHATPSIGPLRQPAFFWHPGTTKLLQSTKSQRLDTKVQAGLILINLELTKVLPAGLDCHIAHGFLSSVASLPNLSS